MIQFIHPDIFIRPKGSLVLVYTVKGALLLTLVVAALLDQFVSCHSLSCFALQRYELASS